MAEAFISVIVFAAVAWWAYLIIEPILVQKLGLQPLRLQRTPGIRPDSPEPK